MVDEQNHETKASETENHYTDISTCTDHPQIIRIRDCLETMRAVLELEYHNRNWLALKSPRKVNEELRCLAEIALRDLPSSARSSAT